VTLSNRQAREILQDADLIRSADEVQAAVRGVARAINRTLADQHPLVLSVMGGAVVFTGQLLPMLDFPLDFDFLHVSRYGNEKRGGELHWKVAPRENVRDKVVLVVDDILDEGETLHAIKQRVMELGASKFYSAVFADKVKDSDKPIRADFVGMELPNRFVFGYGMDIHGAWRNLPAIYAVKDN
jgi:hypoxanthine phosphoribosyltransferase